MGKQPQIVDEITLQAIYGNKCVQMRDSIVRSLRLIDEQQFLGRYKWYNLPYGLNAELVERMLYYRGQLMVFYVAESDKFYALPFTFCGTIDCYGQWTKVRPLPFTGGARLSEDELKKAADKTWLGLIERTPVYDIQLTVNPSIDWNEQCVILTDYSRQISQTILPRQEINESIIQIEADFIPYLKTAMMNSTGISGMRVNSPDELQSVLLASKAVETAAQNQQKWIPINGAIDFQDLTAGNVARSEEFLLAMSSIDNFRKMGLGLGNGQLFEKKEHMLQAELVSNQTDSVLMNGLERRQHFCNIFKSIFPIDVWCELAENEVGYDMNMDGQIGSTSEDDQPSPAAAANEGGTNEQ